MKTNNFPFVALFSAIICILSVVKIPFVAVPFVLQNIVCILTSVILGGFLGCLPTLLFLVLGLIGLPVFSGGTSGLGVFLGPTGGFLIGYFFGALFSGIISGKPKITERKVNLFIILKVSFAIIFGIMIIYVPGVFWFAKWTIKSGEIQESIIKYTMFACVLPNLLGDFIKIIIAIPIALKIRPIIIQYKQQ